MVYVCDCGRTKVTIEPPAELSEVAEYLQCSACGTHIKHYDYGAYIADTRSYGVRT